MLKDGYIPSISDIDIAIVLKKHEKEKEIKFKVLIDKIFENNLFEIHFLILMNGTSLKNSWINT